MRSVSRLATAIGVPVVAGLAAFAVSSFDSPTSASASGGVQACGDRDTIRSELAARFDEQPVAVGLRDDGRVVEVFASDQTRTWTIVISSAEGVSCFAASGEAWQSIDGGPSGPVS